MYDAEQGGGERPTKRAEMKARRGMKTNRKTFDSDDSDEEDKEVEDENEASKE